MSDTPDVNASTPQRVPVIAIDGPSGSGKGAVTQRLAAALGFHILDSGALYRLIGLAARKHQVGLADEVALAAIARQLDVNFVATDDAEEPLQVELEGETVTRLIRTDAAGTDASAVARLPLVRDALIQRQRDFARAPGLVADGRDMGTVVFTDAILKIYLTASAEARAERRYKQLKDKGMGVSLHDLFLSIQTRDEQDMNRAAAPLRPAADALLVDSTEMALDEVFALVLAAARASLGLAATVDQPA
ncbi:MAG: (d)CMP kinase [Pseudomonadales bacterium]|jgi:CMP/dCMP kinase|nr:(d)CMP kinase [Pseudomonadales bacterium]MDP4640507.1 (d)CMP kinase [Pseudomonadales bacterium]MDP4766758.1 (d)CMP kinase [Pseudomonadales bacterium]MDP4874689.1 (d)CMP kinase [Pseudomonadales bacterium]MDP4911100.1 (d)CMP kinase [Pseudomonadales bacterium]